MQEISTSVLPTSLPGPTAPSPISLRPHPSVFLPWENTLVICNSWRLILPFRGSLCYKMPSSSTTQWSWICLWGLFGSVVLTFLGQESPENPAFASCILCSGAVAVIMGQIQSFHPKMGIASSDEKFTSCENPHFLVQLLTSWVILKELFTFYINIIFSSVQWNK